MHLLYVDDDRINLVLFEHACADVDGVRLSTASGRSEALALARRDPPELLAIDLHLSDTNGHDLLLELRELPGLQRVPAYLCTADDSDAVRAAAHAAGFAGCWSKPLDIEALRRELADLGTRTAK